MDTLQRTWISKTVIPNNATIVVGLSGGPDSVFLLHTLAGFQKEKNLTLIAAHLDHGWRPESASDAEFCKELADKYGITYKSKKLSEISISKDGSKEEIGRKARRFFFESLAKEYNAAAITLAHHADDQMENFFIRLIRGASLNGLVGMKEKEGLYIRPLLDLKKRDILTFLDEHTIPYLIDPSNESPEFLRNRIRNTVIPALRECDNRFDHNFSSTHKNLQETEEFLQQLAKKTLSEISDNNQIIIVKLLALHPVLRNRILINWLITNKVSFTPSQGLLDEIVRFLEQSGEGKHMFYEQWNLVKEKELVYISKK